MRIVLTLLLLGLVASAPADELRQPVPGVHALVDVRIVTAPGEVIESGTVVIRDGLITAVGADIDVPPDARLHEFEQTDDDAPVTVYPGLIDPYVAVEGEQDDEDEEVPAGRHHLVNPDRTLRARDWPEDRVDGLRRAGFTTALMAPADGLLRGSGLIANLGDGGLRSNLIEADFARLASFDGRAEGRNFPNSLMGAVALVRQTFDDARWQASARAAWQRNPSQPRPEWFEGLDALAPVFDGTTPLIFESQDMIDSLRILEFIEPGDIDLVMVGHGAEYQRLSTLAERSVPQILTLDFPEAPDVSDADDRNVSLEELRHWQRAPDNIREVMEAGIDVLLTSHKLGQPGEIFGQLEKAIERGLDADAALAALTTAPAAWLGLDELAGRIAPGAMANLVVVEGELMTDSPAISQVWIDGRQHVLAAIVPPEVDPAGTWELTLGLGDMGDVDASLELSGPPRNMQGALTVMGNETPLTEARVSGDRLIASIDASRFGGSGTISIRITIDGDRARGNGSGPFGEFTIRGRRTSGPDDEEVL